jgi:arginyl-tRNA synthetase
MGYTIPSEHYGNYKKLFPEQSKVLESDFIKEEKNYFTNFIAKGENYPLIIHPSNSLNIDSFSPNLNKQLHIGHCRNLVTSIFLEKTCGHKIYCLLGASLGEVPDAQNKFYRTLNLFGLLPKEITKEIWIKKPSIVFEDGKDDKLGCKVYNDVVVIRSDGKPTYSYYELAWNENYDIDLIFTGVEQEDHFKALGLAHKHKALGLIIGPEGKLKSRDGKAILLEDFITEISQSFNTEDSINLAWNVLIGQIYSNKLSSNIKFDFNKWTNVKSSPGLYISYTYCRLKKVLKEIDLDQSHDIRFLNSDLYKRFHLAWDQSKFYLEPVHLQKFCTELCNEISNFYDNNKIITGSKETQIKASNYFWLLDLVLEKLGYFKIEKI